MSRAFDDLAPPLYPGTSRIKNITSVRPPYIIEGNTTRRIPASIRDCLDTISSAHTFFDL